MPSRLSLSRPRTSSRPPPPISRKSVRASSVTLADLRDYDIDEAVDEWEPTRAIDEEDLDLEQVRGSIKGWEEELRAKGRTVSGRTIVVVHSLPYMCTLHPTSSHTTSYSSTTKDNINHPPATALPLPDSLLSSSPPTSGTSTPVEIQPGAPLLRPRAMYAPTSSTQQRGRSSHPVNSFPSPASSLSPSHLPPCPPSRAPSPTMFAPPTPPPSSHRWILHPRRGHAALNAGIKSLANSSLVVVGRPDDLWRAGGERLATAEVGDGERKDLERGLGALGSGEKGGGGAATGGEGMDCVPVWLDDKIHDNFYSGMCKTYLWPILHYLPLPDSLDKETEERSWNAYVEANWTYAKKVAEVYKEGDLIWIHDYHLLLVPKMLRDLLPESDPYISLFLHCPFPSSEYFRCLPRREPILDGILGCNLVCFQTHSYARHFLSSCVRVMGYEAGLGGVDAKGRITRIAHCLIGIDVEEVEKDRSSPGVAPKIEALKRLYEGKKIIVARDKLDPTKGVLPKLRAFERFLQMFPEWSQRVVLIQVTSPSPGDSTELGTKVSELVDSINAMYGTLEFQPVHHYHQTVERDEYFALLTVADLALITSIRDGMNTTCMEYVICQSEAKGSIIVSEFTGVSATLNKAVKVNPWDLGGVAKAIDQCLTMPMTERSMRHAALHETVTNQTAAVWAATNILKLLESLQGEQATQNTPPLDQTDLVKKYAAAGKRLLLFDYDGTLTPIVKIPSEAVPNASLLASLPILCADPKNIVYIISGRDGDFLEEHLGHIDNLGMSAEHGCFIKPPNAKRGADGKGEWRSLTDEIDMDWKKDVLQIFHYYEARTQGSFVEKKVSSVTFHYRNADPVFGLFQAKECQAMLESMQESLPIDVLVGKKNVEVRPAHTNKGEIVQRLLYQYPDTEFCMCAGDDKTDEDMFHALARIFNAATPGSLPLISPPDSLTLFPSLASDLPPGARSSDPNVTELQHVESKLVQSSSFLIAIEARETQRDRMTMANAVLSAPSDLLQLLEQLAKV